MLFPVFSHGPNENTFVSVNDDVCCNCFHNFVGYEVVS